MMFGQPHGVEPDGFSGYRVIQQIHRYPSWIGPHRLPRQEEITAHASTSTMFHYEGAGGGLRKATARDRSAVAQFG